MYYDFKEFRTNVLMVGGTTMKNSYKTAIYKMLNNIDDTDEKFLKQLYTLIKKHLERKRRH